MSQDLTWRNKKCDQHQAYLDSRKPPPQSDKQQHVDNQQEDSNDVPDADDAITAEENDDDVHTGVDTSAAQTARDACECDILDSLDLDGTDEFFECDTFSEADDSNKENAFQSMLAVVIGLDDDFSNYVISI